MAVQYSQAVRNAMLDSIETTVGTNAHIRFYTGSLPATCASASTGTLVATMLLTGNSGDWLSAASGGTKVKHPSSTWSVAASGSGTIGYYRIYDSSESVCHEQGTVTTVAVGTGDIQLDNNVVVATQTITITGKTITAGNA